MKHSNKSNKGFLILKIWPFWIEGIKYHDQYLSEFMGEDKIRTIFACPYQADKYYTNFTDKYNSKTKSLYELFLFKYFRFFGKPVPYNILAFANFIKKNEPDVIHIFGISNFTSIFTLLSTFLVSYNGQIVFSDHSDPNERKSGFLANFYYYFFKLFYNILIRNQYKIIVPDLASKNEVIKRYGQKSSSQIQIISLGYDDRVFNYKGNRCANKIPLVIGFAGKIIPPKKIELIFKVLDFFDNSEIKVIIAGLNKNELSDYQKTLVQHIDEYKLTNVSFKPFISTPEELAAFYSSLDIAIFPGSISITTFEANGCGCPIILFNSYEGLEHRVSNLRGRLFNNLVELKETLNYYLDLKKKTGIQHSEIELESKQFSWRVIKDEYYVVYGYKAKLND